MTFEQVLAIIGAILPIASAIASALNQHVRETEVPSDKALKAQVVINALAANFDKVKLASQALKNKDK